MLKFLFRFLLLVIFLAVLAFIGFMFLGDITPASEEQRVPVTISTQ